MKRYQTTRWSTEIAEIEVLRETDDFMILATEGRKKERREAKKSGFHLYHETWESAHTYLLQRAKDRLVWAKAGWEERINDLKIIESMRKGN